MSRIHRQEQQKAPRYGESVIIDPLYGRITIPGKIWEALLTPEVQRLREIRLGNQTSLALHGGNNVSRYEHSIGAAYLAQVAAENLDIKRDSIEWQAIIIAALTHDVVSSAFGHTVEYVLKRQGFKHSDIVEALLKTKYSHFEEEPIFMGYAPMLKKVIPDSVLSLSYEFIQGKGSFGRLISGDMDIDNLDNVFRLAYHIGIPYERGKAEAIVRAIRLNDGNFIVRKEDFHLIEYWLAIREELYSELFLSPSSFSSTAMLSRAVELAVDSGEITVVDWKLVDSQLIEKLLNSKIPEVRMTIKHLMVGDLFPVIGIFQVENAKPFTDRQLNQCKVKCEKAMQQMGIDGFLHIINDHNNSAREVRVLQSDTGIPVILGRNASRLLVGAIRKTNHWSRNTCNEFRHISKKMFVRDVDTWISDSLSAKLGKVLHRNVLRVEHGSTRRSFGHHLSEGNGLFYRSVS